MAQINFKFNLGDKVKAKDGDRGVIVSRCYLETADSIIKFYEVDIPGASCSIDYIEDSLELLPSDYGFKITVDDLSEEEADLFKDLTFINISTLMDM